MAFRTQPLVLLITNVPSDWALVRLKWRHRVLKINTATLHQYRNRTFNCDTEPAPGHLHQGGIWISRGGGGTNHIVCECVCVCVCVGVGGGMARECPPTICDRVQLLTLAKACSRFLMCTVLSVSLSLSKSIMFSKKGRGWKVRGTVTRLGGGAWPANAPPWRRPCLWHQT